MWVTPAAPAFQAAEVRFAAVRQHRGTGAIPQLHDRGEIGSGRGDRLGEVHVDRGPPRKPLLAPQHRSRPSNAAGNHRHAGLRRDLEGAEVERRQAGATREGAFGEEHQGAARLGEGDEVLRVGHAAGHVVALDEIDAEATQQQPGEELAGEVPLGHVDRIARDDGGNHQGVGITGVIEHQDGAAQPPLIETLHRQRDAEAAQRQARQPADCCPAPVEAGQQHAGDPTQGRGQRHHHPPPAGIE